MIELPTVTELSAAADLVYGHLTPTAQIRWPQLCALLNADVWVKHENHTPVGAFKVRGGLVYVQRLLEREPGCPGLVSATRGNHGQSIGFAARSYGLPAVIYVPHGNSPEKNTAMRALGVELIEHGDDFQEAREEAARAAAERQMRMVPAFHRDLVCGVATYWLEFFRAVDALDVVLVPIGQGSGIASCAAARRALGRRLPRIIGVVSAAAPAYALSIAAGRPVSAPATTQLADGLACRVPDPDALDVIGEHVDEILQVTDEEVGQAMRTLFVATHNVAEGAGAAALVGALQIRERLAGKRVGLTLSGGNVDADVFGRVLLRA